MNYNETTRQSSLPIPFEWDQEKNRSNRAKHKVSFETAIAVFEDEYALDDLDCIVDGEERWSRMGVVDGIVLFVVHTWRCEPEVEAIRIISARKAIPQERRVYAKNRQRTSQ